MTGSALLPVAAFALAASPYSCHKPTTLEMYASAKHCHAVYDAGLAILPVARFARAGVDPSDVRAQSTEDMESAHSFGRQLGMSTVAIFRDTMREKDNYLREHSGPTNARAKLDTLRNDMNDCLGDDFGRYND